jgi:hypothetical protein
VIEVSDNGPGLPVKSYATDNAENGRGLLMVEAMSQEWGCRPGHCGGKVVYAIMQVPRDRPGQPTAGPSDARHPGPPRPGV